MRPLGLLRGAKAPEPILCCGSSTPILSQGSYKVHNDPNRELHDNLFFSFQGFVVRTQHQATLLQLALSHIQDIEGPSVPGSITYIESASIAGLAPAADIMTKFADGPALPDFQAEVTVLPPLSSDTEFSASNLHAAPLSGSNELSDANNSFASFDESGPALLSDSTRLFSPPYLSTDCVPGPPSDATPLLGSGLSCTQLHEFLPVSSPGNKGLFPHTPPTPAKCISTSRLSSAAPTFVPGMFRGSLPSGLAQALNQTMAASTHQLFTTKAQTGWLGGDISTQKATVQPSVMFQEVFEDSATSPHAFTLPSDCTENIDGSKFEEHRLPDVEPHQPEKAMAIPSLQESAAPFVLSYTPFSTWGQDFATAGPSDQYHHDLVTSMGSLQGLSLSRNNIAPLEPLDDLRTFQTEAQDLQYTPQSPPAPASTVFARPETIIHESANQASVAPPLFGSFAHESPSVLPPVLLDSFNHQTVAIPAPIVPAVQSYTMSPIHTSTPKAKSRLSIRSRWKSTASVPSSSKTFSPPSPPHASSIASSWRHRTQDPVVPASLAPVFNLEELQNNPLTDKSSYVIHVTSRLDYGPVLSHRYFLAPTDLNDDWIEISQLQWFARGEPFKMKAEKWDVKCPTHGKFFRMTLRPNLLMRSEPPPKFGKMGGRSDS